LFSYCLDINQEQGANSTVLVLAFLSLPFAGIILSRLNGYNLSHLNKAAPLRDDAKLQENL
jgi:hypothetical protein